ncbi:MAG: ABC transporter ATP-binding protein [Parvibaculaceae bacterium]
MTAMLTVRNLTVEVSTPSGPVYPVESFSMSVAPGEIAGLVGESGSGKTMAMRAIIGLLKPGVARIVSGEVLLDGRDLVTLPAPRLREVRGRDIAMIFQNPSSYLDPLMPVGAQVAEPLRIHRGLSRRAARDEVVELFGRVGIRDPRRQVDAYPHEFSGGMKQRVLIAAALACTPKLLIADEPTTALDATVQKQILDLLRDLRDRTGISVILITHDLGVVAEICDTVTVLYAARIAERAPTAALLLEPLHPYSRGLIQSQPESAARDRPLPSIPGQPPALLALPPGCRFHPRCAFAAQACRAAVPPLVATAPQRANACIRWRELPAGGSVS